tara:strand:+ start:4024 stop:4203 length:180 start_codon:yes stop_codon:yes gene_type:complete
MYNKISKDDKIKMKNLVNNYNAMLAGQYPDGEYYEEFSGICDKYGLNSVLAWEYVEECV